MTTGPLKLIRRVRGGTGSCTLYERGPGGPLVEILRYRPYRDMAEIIEVQARYRPEDIATAHAYLDSFAREVAPPPIPLVDGNRYRLTRPKAKRSRTPGRISSSTRERA